MTIPNDAAERQSALDPTQSFIVQAPAGSGKTELLTQRFLVLLSQVKQPEEILAITFTKKSSAEMRARIIQALMKASTQPEPLEPHAQKTWRYAKKALHQDSLLQWNLLENPNRLRIQTIDAFNAYLTKQLPIVAQFGATPDIIDQPFPLYRAAVEALLAQLEEAVPWADAIAQLLQHLDNDLNKLASLLSTMLAKRDQWLAYLHLGMHAPLVRKQLELHLTTITTDLLKRLHSIFPIHWVTELMQLATIAADHLSREQSSSLISHCLDRTDLPGTASTEKKAWLGLGELLLTKAFEWRKRIDKTMGFPPATQGRTAAEKQLLQQHKQRMTALLTALATHDDLRSAFEALALSPDCSYNENQWTILNALLRVLHVAVAELKLVFQEKGQIDYIENAQAALLALGDEDHPTDITLALDYQIQHILIDEFQDTSTNQYRLLEKLTPGWQPNDGRTLFVVGDPMQSIYRFREAEVGLFIRACHNGIGHIPLTPLTLSVNFRSLPGIVQWVNTHFQSVLPAVNDIAMGAVSYSPSIANSEAAIAQPSVQLHPIPHAESTIQANHIVSLIRALKQNYPGETIAILVRSRTHLAEIIPALQQAQFSYRAIDIDPLHSRAVIQDLLALTRALLHPADRTAWFAMVRAPWCGLLLSDILHLAGNNPQTILWERMLMPAVIAQLSPDGQQRLRRFVTLIQPKITERYRTSLRTWIESTWALLGGPAAVTQHSDLTDAQAFFALLEKCDHSGDLQSRDELITAVSRLYASPDNQADHTLQIMTIHNAKGLEFDHVILPHLERKSPIDDKQLLLWMEQTRDDATHSLLVAPIHGIGQQHDTIYDYIKRQHQIKTDHETGRLLYVAVTRAKKECHLFFALPEGPTESKPLATSLLEKLWDSIKNNLSQTPGLSAVTSLPETTEHRRPLRRFPLCWQNPMTTSAIVKPLAYHQQKTGFQLTDTQAQIKGTVVHRLLQEISRRGTPWWLTTETELKKSFLHTQFIELGLSGPTISTAIDFVLRAVQHTLHDPRGQWILKPHIAAASEFPITACIDNTIQAFIIDRTFIDATDVRWIIDYKTTQPSGPDLTTFLAAEKEKYAVQLSQYATAFRAIETHPICLGLYFPLVPAWIEWPY